MLNQLIEHKQQAQAFWQAWLAAYPSFQKLPAREIVEQSNDILQAHLPDIAFELENANLSASDNAFTHSTIVFTAHGVMDKFIQVQAVCEQAPDNLPCAIRGFRQAMPNPDKFVIGMNDFDLSVSDIVVKLDEWCEMPALEVAFTKTIDDEFLQHAQHMTFIMLDHVLGEWNSAVKLGTVDFIEQADEDFEPLSTLPEKLQTMWLAMGRNGIYPEECDYAVAQIEEDEGQDALFFRRNQSANSLLGRADMAWVVSITCQIEGDDDVQAAYDLQDAFEAYAIQNQQGIDTLSLMNLSQGERTVFAVTSKPEILLAQAQKLCEKFAHLNAQAYCEYDPNWVHYRQ
ncbi:hypothetical protein [Wielerella bovis]|uniref:hypothetical protein n=1 Tax=Wielerella bovis TaxID=2917790 RepID=UPI0020186C4B|nr:hypothetical protein [Wielerella bovis]ULJ59845.1 hypothetical protein MIS44_09210 [Wielerella bovis]